MRTIASIRFWLLVSIFVSLIPARGGGLIIVRDWNEPTTTPLVEPRIYPPIRPPVAHLHYPLAPLEVSSEKIDAKIKDQIATVSIEQEFYNRNNRQLEGTFLFPIPKGAHLDKFKMEIGGRMVEPELLTA